MKMARDYPPALLTYTIEPNSVPYTKDSDDASIVTLHISATNRTGKTVTCERLIFTLPIGEKPGDLTADPSSIAASAAPGTDWVITPDRVGDLYAMPNAEGQLEAGASITFTLEGVSVNGYAGQAEIGVQEYEDADTTRQAYMIINKVETGLAITSFTADPVSVEPGKEVKLAWTTTGAESVTLSLGDIHSDVEPNDECPDTPLETTTYTLAATGGGRTIYQQVTVVVPTVRILSFAAKPEQVGMDGKSTLYWEVVNAESASISGVNQGTFQLEVPEANPSNGRHEVEPKSTTIYMLKATGRDGRTVSMPAVVGVMPVRIKRFEASPNPVWLDEYVTLEWETEWANGCILEPGTRSVEATGSIKVKANERATYKLTALGLTPQSATVTIDVLVPVIRHFGFTTPGAGYSNVQVEWEAEAPEITLEVIGTSKPHPVAGTGSEPVSTKDNARFVAVLTAGNSEHKVQAVASFYGANVVPQMIAKSVNGVNTPHNDIALKWQWPSSYEAGTLIIGSEDPRPLPSGYQDALIFKPGEPDKEDRVWQSFIYNRSKFTHPFSSGIEVYAMDKYMPRQKQKPARKRRSRKLRKYTP